MEASWLVILGIVGIIIYDDHVLVIKEISDLIKRDCCV